MIKRIFKLLACVLFLPIFLVTYIVLGGLEAIFGYLFYYIITGKNYSDLVNKYTHGDGEGIPSFIANWGVDTYEKLFKQL